jgi:hypothetical protein
MGALERFRLTTAAYAAAHAKPNTSDQALRTPSSGAKYLYQA